MNERSDVDMVPIVKENKYLNKILALKRNNREYIKPVDIVPLSIWELKNKKRYRARKEKGPKHAPAIDEFVRFRLVWGEELNPCDFPKREPKNRLRGLVKAWENIFLPYYEKGVFTFEQIIKQVFWLTEYEQMAKGKKHTCTWKELVKSVKDKKHPVHDAWKYRQKPPDEKTKKKFIDKMKRFLERLIKTKQEFE